MKSKELSRKIWRREAFTLVEVMISMAILVLVVAGVMSAFLGTLKSSYAISDAIDLNARSRFIQERLLFDLRAVTEVSDMDSKMDPSEVAKIFASYSGAEVSNCFRSFTALVDEYNSAEGAAPVAVKYTIADDPDAAPLKMLLRQVGSGTPRKVMTNIQEGCFTFYTRKKSTGTLESLESGSKAGVNAIRFAFLPKGRAPLLPGQNDPSCSAVVQLRFPSYK